MSIARPIRVLIVCAAFVFVGAIVLAKIVDWRMSKRELPAAAATRYGVLRRSLMTAPNPCTEPGTKSCDARSVISLRRSLL